MATVTVKHKMRAQFRYLVAELSLVFTGLLYLAVSLVQEWSLRTSSPQLALFLAALLLLSLCGILLAWRLTRSVLAPLRETVRSVHKVNNGYALQPTAQITSDEFGQISGALRQLSQTNQRLEKSAHHDELTSLGNRAGFDRAVQGALLAPGGTAAALLLVDLDHLRRVNEAYGYSFGDECLRETARRLGTALPPEARAYRHGAGLFAVLWAGLPPLQARERALQLAENLRRTLAQPVPHQPHPVNLSASIGLALAPSDGSSLDELMSGADAALHKAKQSGRNCVQQACRDLALRTRRRMELAEELRLALPNNALRPYYQPIVDVSKGRLASVEVLCRWPRLGRGFVPPDDFIPVAEETGQLDALTQHLMRSAFEDAARWQRSARPLRVAVNLSARQMRQDFIASLIQQLERSGLSPRLLDVEITESAFMEKPGEVERILREIKHLGIGVCLDDFGTGYSSLSYLQRLPIDKLKIDKSFVQKLGQTEQADRIVAATAVLANSLGIALVGEGVETLEQLTRLRELGCNLHQGYYFARALPAVDLERWVPQPLPPLQMARAAA